MRIYLCRHAEPDYSIDSLTPKGWREAELLSRRISRLKRVEGWYVSPLGRARDTASLTMPKVGREAVVLPWLREFRGRAWDPFTGKETLAWDFRPRTLETHPELYRADEWLSSPIYQGTNTPEVWRETCEGVDDLLGRHGFTRDGCVWHCDNNRRGAIVVFCHYGISMAICAYLLGIAPLILWQGVCMLTSSVTCLCSEERVKGEVWWRLESVGDLSHLAVADERPSTAGQFPEVWRERETTEPIEWED